MWKAILATLGAAIGVFLGLFVVGYYVRHNRIGGEMWAIAAIEYGIFFGAPPGAALLSLLGFGLGTVLDRRSRRDDSPKMWKILLAVVGAAAGPIIGIVVGVSAVDLLASFGEFVAGEELGGCLAEAGLFAACFLAPPAGAALLCLLGLSLGSKLDRRARRGPFPEK